MRGLVIVAILVLVGACDKASHENVDRWRFTQQGPGKLEKALANAGLDPDLRAHAAQALVEIDAADKVRDALGKVPDATRAPILDKLLERLWGDAKVNGDLQVPTGRQVSAKDALFDLRALATDEQRARIDGYLIDWLTPLYEGRGKLGRHHGEVVLRAVGPRAAPKLIAAARQIVDRPEQGGKIILVEDLLLRGIAATGAPEGTGYLLDLAALERYPEPTLPRRAMRALATIHLEGAAIPGALAPHGARLAKIAADEKQDGETANLAFELLAASGREACVPPLLTLVRHRDAVRSWQAVRLGLQCGGAPAIGPIVEALPDDRGYERGILDKYLWNLLVPFGKEAADAARTMLTSRSWVARVTGVELLARIGGREDAAKVRALAKDEARLRGWWPKGERKSDPRLGEIAAAVSEGLERKQ